ncbi:MAG: hypothetical protein SO135_00230 [Sphaerochaetaceae bacterium]|nr:hypothetical protein [Sphaerochaetaceae bacterium]
MNRKFPRLLAFIPSSEYIADMDYISVKEAAANWQISERRVRSLCSDGRIEGAARHGDWAWSIPTTTARPIDGRSLRFIKNESFRTGAQNYALADSMRNQPSSPKAIQDSVFIGLCLDDSTITVEEIEKVLDKRIAENLSLDQHVIIANTATFLEDRAEEISDYNIRMAHRAILTSADNENRGRFRSSASQHEFATLMLQYKKDWEALHPIARATFLFGELMRIKPFINVNGIVAICMLQTSLRLSDYPMADITPANSEELKAAMAAVGKRGNYQTLVKFICDAIARKDQ